MPVLKHYTGNCHVYVDADADQAIGREAMVVNAKAHAARGSATPPRRCSSTATPRRAFLPLVADALRASKGVEIRGDEATRAILPAIRLGRVARTGMPNTST